MIPNGLYTLAFSLTNKLFFLFLLKSKHMNWQNYPLSIVNCQLNNAVTMVKVKVVKLDF